MLRETLHNAARLIDRSVPEVTCSTWESLKVGGKLVITPILAAIDGARVAVFEVTELNENVMFELGYAIGSKSAVWLLRDPTEKHASPKWDKMRTLTTVGFSPYANSEHIKVAFIKDRPDLQNYTIYEDVIEPSLEPRSTPALFYIRSLHETEAASALTRRVHEEERQGLRVITADPNESAVLPLAWYAQQIYAASGVVVHFESPKRQDAEVHNARCALIAGLAKGMGQPLLMLAQEEYLSPVDYRDLLYIYGTARYCVSHTDGWLTRVLEPAYQEIRAGKVRASRLQLSTELKSLRFGDHVAENEADVLTEYFLETPAFDEVIARKTTVFVGRKGAGKSANFLQAAERLRQDKRHLVCEIKPYGYEIEAVIRLLRHYSERDEKGYVVESLWKFLLYSEIALAAAAEITSRPYGVPRDSAEWELAKYLDDAEFLTQDFGIRLERTVGRLVEIPGATGVGARRAAISEALHHGVISELRQLLFRALTHKTRVAVLVDNLDKAWDRSADVEQLAVFLLGLLTSVESIESEFARQVERAQAPPVTLAVFVRSDIFRHVVRAAAEPDKIPTSRIQWTDSELLLRVVEERYLATREHAAEPDELWHQYFCATVRDAATRDYIAARVLPRPRDIVFFCNAAITAAINHRRSRIEEDDILAAEAVYSEFAFEALQVEDVGEHGDLELIVLRFAGAPATSSAEDVRQVLREASVAEEALDAVVTRLRSLSFLGMEVAQDRFDYADEEREMHRADTLAARLSTTRGESARFAIHPAFRAYLQIEEPKITPG